LKIVSRKEMCCANDAGLGVESGVAVSLKSTPPRTFAEKAKVSQKGVRREKEREDMKTSRSGQVEVELGGRRDAGSRESQSIGRGKGKGGFPSSEWTRIASPCGKK